MGFLAIMLALMAMRQILALWGNYEHWNILIVGQLTELLGLVVSIMALLTIFFLKHIFTERRQIDEQLSYQANHDTLTGLVNRREFERRTERLLSTIQRDNGEHALCFMDLDQFKVVNDTCGHAAGDELLRQLGSVLTVTLRHRDTLARLGGDEFGILMEHCSLDDAHRVATSLQKAIQEYRFVWEGRSFKVGVSIGLVPITPDTINFIELIKDADAACYMAKDKGRNCIHVYHDEDIEKPERHGEMQWALRISRALEADRFYLYAQPIVPLDGSSDEHYELLIRMMDENGEFIPPGAFLPAAERYSLISKLDHWVIEHVFDLLADNPVFLKQISFCSINLSGQSLTDPEILEFIITQLDESGIQSQKICFEITETAAISHLDKATKFISTLKGLGCRFALDDFGSGLSSFAYLKNLPVDYLKIDGMFVKDIVDDPINHAMVKSINEIGHVMGMLTIAKFVENDVIKGMLKEIGVNYGQGNGIGKPQPLDELFVRASNVNDTKISIR
jgi:diguanylate cyclase (GGDEF)-like protein